jgi:hypothetical protein
VKGVRTHQNLEFLAMRFSEDLSIGSLDFVSDQLGWDFGQFLRSAHFEWAYRKVEGMVVRRGQVDLWGVRCIESQNELWIFDYKTGERTNFDSAFVQLNNYAKDIQRVCPQLIQQCQRVFLGVILIQDKKVIVKEHLRSLNGE